MKHIKDIAYKINLKEEDIEYYGKYKAKILKPLTEEKQGKLILVTALNPTSLGSGKTTIAIGLGDAFGKLGKNAIIALREPSLGPVFGVKGGATGGGKSIIIPENDINLHFTGDFHAITSANNLLCSAIDNHIWQGNILNIDINNITFKRCLDLNDRSLREIRINPSGKHNNGTPREDAFTITAASEIMAIFCLAKDIDDLEKRIDNIVIAYNKSGKPIFCKELNVTGSMIALLKDAIKPNLVQTLEGNPVIIHGGPFANIAHGCNSIIATKTAISLADYTITEAGFGADLGALKFLDIKCREMNIYPDCIVLVASIRDLKYNGGVATSDVAIENFEALKKGSVNLEAHIDNLKALGTNLIVAINKFTTDTDEEIEFIKKICLRKDVRCEVSTAYINGGEGAVDLANTVIESMNSESKIELIYDVNDSIETKIKTFVTKMYNAKDVVYSKNAQEKIAMLVEYGFDKQPICISKTQFSLSDNPKLLGRPNGYIMTVSDIRLYNGAGFITVSMGDVFTMPGLPNHPAYEKIYIEDDIIKGIF